MKKISQIIFYFLGGVFAFNTYSQGLISMATNDKDSLANFIPSCGSYDMVKNIDRKKEEYTELSDQFMKQLNRVIKNQKRNKSNKIYTVPVVFHIVYNNDEENLPDSVIIDQVDILNECFRRKNADTSETRTEFLDIVGDSRIEFKLAEFDPSGSPSNGITRTSSSVTNFGGVLPYGPGQGQQIDDWVNDSLFYNYFKITNSNLGGKDPWDTDKYLNIWIGDLRNLQPQFNNFEQIIFFALATPPVDHINWPDSLLDEINVYEQGVLMHYVNIGSNNPNSLPFPYQTFNGVTTGGKLLVHEVGHYLGLRHIWGDGDCSFDDFIHDTPNATGSSNWGCNSNTNNCIDTINGMNLPNMIENYMDYSSNDCQNSFTLGQIDLMHSVLEAYRPKVFDTISSLGHQKQLVKSNIKCYPNPSSGELFIDLGNLSDHIQITILNHLGQVIEMKELNQTQIVHFNIDAPSGIYFARVNDRYNQNITIKFIIQ